MIRMLAIMVAVGTPFLIGAGLFVILPSSVNKGSLLVFIVLGVIILLAVGSFLYFFRRKRLI
jgi:hypothetical protein